MLIYINHNTNIYDKIVNNMKKPNQITEMKLIVNNFIPFNNSKLICFFGNIYIRKKTYDRWLKDEEKGRNENDKNHEMTHVKQAIKCHNSWILYYLHYIWLYLKNLPIINGIKMPYKFIEFELEAYAHQYDNNYNIIHKDGTDEWKMFKKLTLKQKKQLYKQYKESKLTFTNFINEKIIPIL
nr:MAG: hypothetical protein [Bacteriophage sp.]